MIITLATAVLILIVLHSFQTVMYITTVLVVFNAEAVLRLVIIMHIVEVAAAVIGKQLFHAQHPALQDKHVLQDIASNNNNAPQDIMKLVAMLRQILATIIMARNIYI
jgi:hypothetical protein